MVDTDRGILAMTDESKNPAIPPTVALGMGDDIDPRVAEIVDDFFEKQQSGIAPSVDDIVAANPDIAEELRECLEGIQLVSQTQTKLTPQLEQLGDFRIIREIGRGGMGVVYEAEQISLKRRVALKVLRYMVADAEAMERFKREAETVASLHHSNIVPIYAVGQADGINYFAMQFIEGESLAEVQANAEQQFEPLDVADWGLQAAEALAYAHSNDIIHRDVKPSNLIRDKEGLIWLTDFGLAKRLDDVELSMTGAILGTPRYMSPEQASSMSRPVDHRTDIYSLGATLYEFATGKPMFDATSPHLALGKIINDDPAAPRTVRPGLPRDLETIILRCVSKDALNRYESADQLVADLRAFIDGKPIQSRRPSVTERFGRWLQKNQKSVSAAAMTVAIGAILIGSAYFAVTEYHQSRLGQIRFNSGRKLPNPIVAEILRPDGSDVVSSFTLPTQHHVDIPQGEYELRLSSAGEMSDSYHFSVNATHARNPIFLNTHLKDANVFKPTDIDGEWAVWNRDGENHFVTFDDRGGVVLRDGKSMEVIWKSEFEDDDEFLKAASKIQRREDWLWVPSRERNGCYTEVTYVVDSPNLLSEDTGDNSDSEGNDEDRAIQHKPLDLDKDGVSDLVLACRHHPLTMALSGKDGSLLWFNVEEPQVRTDAKLNKQREFGCVVGSPVATHIDDDGISDFLACYASIDGIRQGMVCYLRGISGADGTTLWQQPVDSKSLTTPGMLPPPFMARWFPNVNQILFPSADSYAPGGSAMQVKSRVTSATTSRGKLIPYPIQSVPGTKGKKFVLCVGKILLTCETESGQIVNKSPLSDVPLRAPQWVDADNDGTWELLVCTMTPVKPNARPTTTMTLRNPISNKAIWSKTLKADFEHMLCDNEIVSRKRKWPLITDLENDGSMEIVIPGANNATSTWMVRSPVGRLTVLKAADGTVKWTSDPIVNAASQLNDFTIVGDLDGDEVAEVAAVSAFGGPGKERGEVQSYVFVDVLSGANGKIAKRLRSMNLEHASRRFLNITDVKANRGRIAVEVAPLERHSNAPHRILLFHLNGETCNEAARVTRPRFVDLDGDDAELVCWSPINADATFTGGKLRTWRLDAAEGESWRHANNHFVGGIGDIDGDGIEDAIRSGKGGSYDFGQVSLLSGATGKTIWKRKPWKTGAESNFLRQRRVEWIQPISDINEDGFADIFLQAEAHDIPTSNPWLIVSGKTGEPLWQPNLDFEAQWIFSHVSVTDLDGDKKPEFLVTSITDKGINNPSQQMFGNKGPSFTFCVGLDGKVRWSQQRFNGQPAMEINDFGKSYLRLRYTDLNKDGIQDVIYYGANEQLKANLEAFSGKDGTALWKAPLAGEGVAIDGYWQRLPEFAVIDDVVISATTIGYQRDGNGPGRQRLKIQAVAGQTGESLWQQTLLMGDVNGGNRHDERSAGVSFPVAVRTRAGTRLGIWQTNDEGLDFVLIDVNGQDENRVTHSYRLDQREGGNFNVARKFEALPVDLNDDDVDELVCVLENAIVAISLEDEAQRELWRVPIDKDFEVHTAEQTESGFELVLHIRDGRNPNHLERLMAVDGQGREVWSRLAPKKWRDDHSKHRPVVLKNTNGAPRVLYRLQYAGTACEVAMLHDTAGKATSRTRGEPPQAGDLAAANAAMPTISDTSSRQSVGASDEVRYVRKMNMSFFAWRDIARDLPQSLLIIGLPLLYIRRLSQRSWSLLILMMAPVVTGLVWVGLRLPNRNYSPQYHASLEVANLQRGAGIFFLVVPLVIFLLITMRSIRQRRWKKLAGLISLMAVMMGLAMIFDMLSHGFFMDSVRLKLRWIPWGTLLYIGATWAGSIVALVLFFRWIVLGTAKLFSRLTGTTS